MPWVRILVFALALTHAVGLADLVLDDACEELCTDDGCGDDCLPGMECRCHCPSAMPALSGGVQTIAKLAPPREVAAGAIDPQLYADPDPREILHVPKPSARPLSPS